MYPSPVNDFPIAAILQLILDAFLLITFLVMANNVKKIKKSVVESDDIDHYKAFYYIHVGKGNNEKALECLQYIVYLQLVKADPEYPGARKEIYDSLENKYSKNFESLGAKFPPYPYNN